MLKVGIYGRIASGKSEVAKVFAETGARVISADAIGKEVVERDEAVLAVLVKEFGPSIIDSDGILNRRQLGRLAFASEERRSALDSIVHPPLLTELRRRLDALEEDGRYTMVVVDAALIVKWAIEAEFDILIFVTALEKVQIKRLEVSGLSRSEAMDRLNAQLSNEIQATSADYVIENNGSLMELRKRALQVHDELIGRGK
jgi:dephospho-CoA kinase